MANSLTITLTELKTLGSSEVHCGYVAMDDFNEAVCRVSTSWESFKAEFPTLEALLSHVLGEDVFSGLNASYTVNGLSIELDESQDEDQSLSYISVEGAEFIYGDESITPSPPVEQVAVDTLRGLLTEALDFTVGDLDYDNFELLKDRAAPYLPGWNR
ncbi:hypothetical protein H8F21_13665 [Pseudomonas sp. P66]|uniref:Uncharacterized protein n=1 Tax=Pseudomonas arcuscaelestis TaxID=2710591 RepID=A0ABS2BYB8_9PSED|nr:hypothetical protein [Pseudomonas arcuscaelestis]MBM5458612.1 hypothetical protein [Pseudomonas arcuscaelestis]